MLEIDAVGTYNMCKAVYDHCFKVQYVIVEVTRYIEDDKKSYIMLFSLCMHVTLFVIGLWWNYCQYQCHATLLWSCPSGQKTCTLLPTHTLTHTHTHTYTHTHTHTHTHTAELYTIQVRIYMARMAIPTVTALVTIIHNVMQ